jgi:hypothetical protein
LAQGQTVDAPLCEHFVQDIHQLLHMGDRHDRGGNLLQVQIFGEGSNLHRVWDGGPIGQEHTSERSLVQRLEAVVASEDASAWLSGTPANWANESVAAAKRASLNPTDDRPLRAGARLGKVHQQAQDPVALTHLRSLV